MPGHEADRDLLEQAVRAAGGIAKRYAAGENKRWRKPDGSPVSEGDLAVDRFLNERLCAARPDYAWLSEESADDSRRLSAERMFMVDPIDGTVAFLKGKPEFVVSAAVVEGERPVAAAVYNPMTDECFAAAKGAGTWLNGELVRVSGRDSVEGSRMLASRRTLSSPIWAEPWPEMTVASPNSIAYRFSLVAGGIHDAAITISPVHDWDLAAADLIVVEAGGLATSLAGEPLLYNRASIAQPSALAAGPVLHARILARLRYQGGKEPS